MNRIQAVLSIPLVLVAVACDPSTAAGPDSPASPAGQKADGVDDLGGDCMTFHLDYVDCQDNAPKDFSCEASLNDEHPEAVACCGGPDEWAFCDLSTSFWCVDLASEHLDCSEHAPLEVACDDLTDERPLAPLCGEERFATCDGVEAQFRECEDNADGEACENFVADFYPGADTCCGGDESYAFCFVFEDEDEDEDE